MALLTQEDVFPWVESTLGGKIAGFTRQGGRESGGRPGWFIELDRGGEGSRPLQRRNGRRVGPRKGAGSGVWCRIM